MILDFTVSNERTRTFSESNDLIYYKYKKLVKCFIIVAAIDCHKNYNRQYSMYKKVCIKRYKESIKK